LSILKKKVSPQEMKSKLAIALKKLEKREQVIDGKRGRSRDEAKESLKKGDERGFRVASRRYSLIDGQMSAVSNLTEMAMSTLDILEMQANVNEIVEIGSMLSEYQKSLGIDNDKLQDALTNINVSMENLTEATEMISTTIDSIAEASPEATSTQEMLRSELMAEIETEVAPAAKVEEELEEKIKEAQRE
jgi:hypothetical protein